MVAYKRPRSVRFESQQMLSEETGTADTQNQDLPGQNEACHDYHDNYHCGKMTVKFYSAGKSRARRVIRVLDEAAVHALLRIILLQESC